MTEKKTRITGKPYNKWSHDEKTKLIKIRIELDDMFTSKNANMNDGWRRVAESFGDPTKDLKACRQLWKNLSQKYKSFFEQHTGDGAGDDAPTNEDMESWPFFKMFNEYATKKHNYHPPFLIESSLGAVSMAPTVAEPEDISEPSLSPSASSVNEYSFSTVTSPTSPIGSSSRASTRLSAFQKYCVKRDKKLTKQMGAMMAIFGQMVAKDYPDINVDNLLICSSSEED